HPLGRAEQARFLTFPGRIDDRPPRTPSLLHQCTQRARLLPLGDQAGDRIVGAVHPCVMVIATDDPLIAFTAPRQYGDHVVEWLERPIALDPEMHLCRAGSHPGGERQSPTPRFWGDRTGEGGE